MNDIDTSGMSWRSNLDFAIAEKELLDSSPIKIMLLKDVLSDIRWVQTYDTHFHVELECGLAGVFKPEIFEKNSKFFDSTVLGYQLSKKFDLDVVPPAVTRKLDLSEFGLGLEVEGSLQLFISRDFWKLENQSYTKRTEFLKRDELDKMNTFQYLAGVCDRHPANQIIDNAGNAVIIDVNDIFIPKMIVANEWEYLLVGEILKCSNDFSELDFEKQPVKTICNPSAEIVKRLFRPFVRAKFASYIEYVTCCRNRAFRLIKNR